MKITARFENVRTPRSTTAPADTGVSPAARNLALAYRLAELIDQGQIADYTAAARLLGVSQPRLTHQMSLTLLAAEIQAAILSGTIAPGDKQLRELARIAEWPAQLERLARFHADGRSGRRAPPGATPTASPRHDLPDSLTASSRSTSDD